MMKSASEAALGQDTVPPYLRAYGSSYRSGRYGHRYNRIEGESQGDGKNESRLAWQKALSVVTVFFLFGVAASGASLRWADGGRKPPDSMQPIASGGSPYRGMFEEERVSDNLVIVARNEYGEFDRRALALYGLEMVIEPYRETTISIRRPKSVAAAAVSPRFRWLLVKADEFGLPLENAEAEINAPGGSFATVTLTEAGATYALLVQQVLRDGSVIAEGRVKISCKYVRRELRDLTADDRTRFFSAMRDFYTVTLEAGREKYGDGFVNAKRVAAFHNSEHYCYHNGIHFLNAHNAFDLWVERTLQMIDPKVSLASWDFMLDAAELSTNWPSSPIFGPDMFGSALGSAEDQFQISDGWFAGITSAYDPDDVLADQDVRPAHSPYGYVGAPYNYQAVPGVIRTHTFCGLEGEAELAQCDVFVNCFQSNNNLHDWATCMEIQVHASLHGTIGGGFDCNVDMAEFYDDNPQYTRGLLTFVLEYVLANKWPSNSLMGDFNECDESCASGQDEPCGCRCTIDPFTMSDDEVYNFMEDVMVTLSDRWSGDQYIDEDTSRNKSLGFKQDEKRLDEESTILLLRQIMVIACEPGSVGAMSTGASPLDPIFWVLHPAFEKAFHILELAPGYRDTYDMEWVDSECKDKIGGNLTDSLPFTEQSLGMGVNSDLLTNAELSLLLNPSNSKLPYLYDEFNKWGTCTDWDPCPECVATYRFGDEAAAASVTLNLADGNLRSGWRER